MNLLSILMGAIKMWDSLPDGEKTAIVDVTESLVQRAVEHKQKMAEAKKSKE